MTDFTFALRQLFKHPGYAAIAILTFDLGIGSTTANFSVVTLRKHVVLSALKLVAVGLAIGLPAALLVARALQYQLFEIGPSDPVTLLAITLIQALAAALAAGLPAGRAARVDPLVALRTE